MDRQTLDVDVHREADGYWAQVRGLEGCFATGDSLDELLAALHEALASYLGESEPERILTRVTALRLEVEPDLRPATAEHAPQSARPPKRRSHRARD